MSDACQTDTLGDGLGKCSKETECKFVKYSSNFYSAIFWEIKSNKVSFNKINELSFKNISAIQTIEKTFYTFSVFHYVIACHLLTGVTSKCW